MNDLTQQQQKKLLAAASIIEHGDMAVLAKILEFQDFLENYKENIEQNTNQIDTLSAKIEELRGMCDSCMASDTMIVEQVNKALSTLETTLKTQITASQGVSSEQLQSLKDSFNSQIQVIRNSIPSMPDLSSYENRLNEIEQKIPEIKETILDTPVELRDKLETLTGDERLDKSAIKGLDLMVEQPTLDRAIEILDKRTQYLLNKPVAVSTSSGGGSGSVTSFGFTNGSGFTGTVSNSTTTPTLALTTSLTTNSVPFIGTSGALTENNNNFYFQNSATTPTQLGTNTNVALSVNTNGDFTGTDAINIYAQYDAYLPNSVITNSLSGLNTDGAVPGYTVSSSRGTGASPSQLQANDLIGGFFGFAAQGASSPTYQNLGGMAVLTTGASTNNLGGELRFYTKADGGSLTQQLSISNAGLATFVGAVTATSFNGVALTAAGSASLFLTQAGTYVAGGSGTVTSIVAGTGLTGGTITTTGTIALDLTRANTWTGAPTISTVPFTISGNQSANSWTTNGIQLSVAAATLNDATSTGTVTTEAASAFGIPTITATSSTTFTNYATVYIAGAPVNSTNVTITNKWALYIAAGNASFGGTVTVGSQLQANNLTTTNSPTTANLGTASNNTVGSQASTPSLLFGGAANTQSRVYINGSTSTTLTANASYTNLNVGISPVTIAGSGTHAWLANAVINSMGTIGGSGATVTNTTTLYVGAASSTGTNKYTAYFDTGNVQIANGNITLGTAGNKINITTGSNASAGTGTLSGGTATISTTAVTASSLIFLTDVTTGALTNVGSLTVGTVTAGTSFVVNSTNVLDSSNFNWLIIN